MSSRHWNLWSAPRQYRQFTQRMPIISSGLLASTSRISAMRWDAVGSATAAAAASCSSRMRAATSGSAASLLASLDTVVHLVFAPTS
jgi:hypothetical protein